jgi:hypothetical protein
VGTCLGTTVSTIDLPVGTYTVSFSSITGQTTPSDQIAVITAGNATTIIGSYTAIVVAPSTGTLNVSTNNSQGSCTVKNSNNISVGICSGTSVASLTLAVGRYTVTFGAVTGYTTPGIQSPVITSNNTTTIIGNYTVSCTSPQVLQNGVCVTPPYADNGNGTISANLTGLMWQKQDDGVPRDWATAGTYCSGLSLGGYSGWRLPTKDELVGIWNNSYTPAIDPIFTNTKHTTESCAGYWSSTTADFPAGSTNFGDTSYAWAVFFLYGNVNENVSGCNKTYQPPTTYVRCVRLGQ